MKVLIGEQMRRCSQFNYLLIVCIYLKVLEAEIKNVIVTPVVILQHMKGAILMLQHMRYI